MGYFPDPGSTHNPPPSDTTWHHRLQDSGSNTLGHMLTPTGSLWAQAHDLPKRLSLEEYFPLCRPSSCYLLKDC